MARGLSGSMYQLLARWTPQDVREVEMYTSLDEVPWWELQAAARRGYLTVRRVRDINHYTRTDKAVPKNYGDRRTGTWPTAAYRHRERTQESPLYKHFEWLNALEVPDLPEVCPAWGDPAIRGPRGSIAEAREELDGILKGYPINGMLCSAETVEAAMCFLGVQFTRKLRRWDWADAAWCRDRYLALTSPLAAVLQAGKIHIHGNPPVAATTLWSTLDDASWYLTLSGLAVAGMRAGYALRLQDDGMHWWPATPRERETFLDTEYQRIRNMFA